MKFIVSSQPLLKQLQLISGAINNNSVLPILEYFLFDISKGEATISASDLETSMITSMEVQSKDKGRICIPARLLMDTLKALPEHPITFSFDEKTFAVELTSDMGKYKLNGANPDDFPKLPIADDTTELNLPATVLSYAINKTLFAVSNDELRPAMTGVFCQFDKSSMTFVATDAHKLVRYKREDIKAPKSGQFIVPKKPLNLLKGSLPLNDSPVKVSFNNANAFFTFDNVNLICRLIDARYPDYNAVIPTNNTNRLVIGRSELLGSLRRISIFSNKTTHQVVLSIKGSQLHVSAQDLDFSNEAHEQLNCSYEGEDMEIGFNSKFLIEMLNSMDGDEISLLLSTPSRAGLILPTEKSENEDMLMLVMPVMLNV